MDKIAVHHTVALGQKWARDAWDGFAVHHTTCLGQKSRRQERLGNHQPK